MGRSNQLNHNTYGGFSSQLSDDGGFIATGSPYYYQISYIDKQAGSYQGIILPQISISNNCLNKLKTGHDAEKIVVAKIFNQVTFKLHAKKKLFIIYLYIQMIL